MTKYQYTKAMSTLLALAVFATGCTKPREASLSEDAQEMSFAISEIDTLSVSNSQIKIMTDSELSALSYGEAAKATAEKGRVAIQTADVPKRLQYMFKGLEISGQAGHSYPIVLSVDKQFVTAYKVISNPADLSILEKQLAKVKEEVLLQQKLQKTSDLNQAKALMQQMSAARGLTTKALQSNNSQLLVPIFKYAVKNYGVLQRIKNEYKEETSNLRLKASEWSEATHIQMSNQSADRILVGLEPASRGEMDRTFVANRINNKLMTADVLDSEYQIKVNLAPETRVLTLLDVDVMHVFEVGQIGKTVLTDSQMQQLKLQSAQSNVRLCSEEIKKALPAAAQENCILVLRYDVPVSYVQPELPIVDYDGNQDARINFRQIRAANSVGLVQIAQNVEPTKIESNNELDPRSTVRVSDIKGKEFFFRRTLEDAPATSFFAPGMSGNLTIVKFELEEDRLVVRQADRLVEYKSGANSVDFEELMSIKVKYLKHDNKSASGAQYAIARLVPATRVDAEFIELDWAANTLSSERSPYATLYNQCFTSVASNTVSDVEMKLDQGALNYSVNYSVGLANGCVAQYRAADEYNGTASSQTTARMKERISFMVNDGRTNQSFVNQIPFSVQNELGYGVWTIGKMNPTDTGLLGRQGQEINLPVVHDFRNGRTIKYVVTGLEASVDLPADIRELYRETTVEVVNAWDLAYRQAFKGTSLERSGRYVEVQFSGDNGVSATVGDLDKNIIHYENKFNRNHGILGVSQVGYNPRSGIVVADSLIVYAGNLQQFVASQQRNQKIAQSYAAMKEEFKKSALEQLKIQQEKEASAPASATTSGASAEQKVQAATNFTTQLLKMTQGQKADGNALLQARDLKISGSDVRSAARQMKQLGASNFAYSSPTNETGWIDRVLRKIGENKMMDSTEIEGLVAKELLASKGGKMSAQQRTSLQRAANLGQIRTQLNSEFKSRPGCMLTTRDSISKNFAARTYKEALKEVLYFDLAHEMGHSQGLTHNFVGSYDKANFSNQDGTASKRLYSSIMDYFEPSQFQWDGLGSYDVHALRASHLGLFEATPEFIANLKTQGASNLLVNGKFLKFDMIKANFMKNGMQNFSKRAVKGFLKEFKYCTDIHVGYEPICQRFDFGTTPEEIVSNLVQDYDESYAINYHAWDRNEFDVLQAGGAISASINSMFQIRQFMDETFYHMAVTGDQEATGLYFPAALKAYLFYNRVIQTPDAMALFQDQNRFMAVPYKYEEVNSQGAKTGKVITDVEIVEKRALSDLSLRDYRVDTVGYEYDKIMAMNFLTMKGYPHYKYYNQSLLFSFLDFEKYALGMDTQNSFVVNTLTSVMLDQLSASFTNDNVMLSPLQEKATVTAAMRSYAGIYGILNLEASTLDEKSNFANLFKVGSSLGRAPNDRVALSQLGVSDTSSTRLSYWAADNATAINGVLQFAGFKDFFLKNKETLNPLMENLVTAQVLNILSGEKEAEKVSAAQAALTARLNELNKTGLIVDAETVKANPQLSVENQVQMIGKFNQEIVAVIFGVLSEQKGALEYAGQLKDQAEMLAENLPLMALNQLALRSSFQKMMPQLAKNAGLEVLAQAPDVARQLVDGSQLEVSYGIIMKNMEFLNRLTLMTNPQMNR